MVNKCVNNCYKIDLRYENYEEFLAMVTEYGMPIRAICGEKKTCGEKELESFRKLISIVYLHKETFAILFYVFNGTDKIVPSEYYLDTLKEQEVLKPKKEHYMSDVITKWTKGDKINNKEIEKVVDALIDKKYNNKELTKEETFFLENIYNV